MNQGYVDLINAYVPEIVNLRLTAAEALEIATRRDQQAASDLESDCEKSIVVDMTYDPQITMASLAGIR